MNWRRIGTLRGKDAPAVDINEVAAEAAKLIPSPKDGEKGADGTSADPAYIREQVAVEVARAIAAIPTPKDGRDGRDGIGKDGRDGINGRDALELEILPAIDPAKSYPRGTFACHKGGIVRRGMADTWETVVEGIAGIEITQGEDPRVLELACYLTGGGKSNLKMYIPMLIYREIFKEGTEYQSGDVVTWGGSAWHCQQQTRSKPGTGPDWKLMVKEGRAGKDGKDGGNNGNGGAPPVVSLK